MGVAGCSSIDIISILNKQKIKPDSLQIQVEGDRLKGQVPLCLQQYTLKLSSQEMCLRIVCFAQPNCHLKSIAQYQKH